MKERENSSFLNKIEKMHPHHLLFFFGMSSIVIVFLFLIFSLVHVKMRYAHIHIDIPFIFYINLFLISSASAFMIKADRYFHRVHFLKTISFYILSLVFGVLFLISQIFTFLELFKTTRFQQEELIKNYIYVIALVHFFHVTLGCVLVIGRIFYLKSKIFDAIKILVIETNPYEKLLTQLISKYWHIMTFLWWCIFIVFVF